MKKLPWNNGGAETRFWEGRPQALESAAEIQGLATSQKEKCGKCHQKLYRKRETKNAKIYAERVPKVRQNRCHSTSKINAKIGIETNDRDHQKLCSSDG